MILFTINHLFKCQTVLFDPEIEPHQVLPRQGYSGPARTGNEGMLLSLKYVRSE